MKELSGAEKRSVMLWNAVVNALLNHIQHHQDQVLATVGSPMAPDIHFKGMHRAARTLTVFLDPFDD